MAQRIANVETVMLADFGSHHVPDQNDELRYFRSANEARVARRIEAERRVRAHDVRVERLRRIAEQAREQQETLCAAIAAGVVSRPTLRDLAMTQRAAFEASGILGIGDGSDRGVET
jgi:hypothetical protein